MVTCSCPWIKFCWPSIATALFMVLIHENHFLTMTDLKGMIHKDLYATWEFSIAILTLTMSPLLFFSDFLIWFMNLFIYLHKTFFLFITIYICCILGVMATNYIIQFSMRSECENKYVCSCKLSHLLCALLLITAFMHFYDSFYCFC
jgi:hypothetical protein